MLIESPTTIDSSISLTISKANIISLTKNFVENEKIVETQTISSKFSDEAGIVSSGTRLWSSFGYDSKQTNNFNMSKVNCPVNTIIYIDQAYLTVKNNKKMYYADIFFGGGQVTEALIPPENISNYVCKEREVKLVSPRYDPSTGGFLGLN